MAGLEPRDIEYVNLHATATPANDASEYRAMRTVFGEEGLRSVLLHATKPAIGHCLGGAGAVEAVIAILVLLHQCVPPSPAPTEPEPEMAGLVFVDSGVRRPIRHAMSNSFGFGGCNTSLVFGSAES
jgi:3-oxoacyl-(acyl-carrier-protein) synthase